MPEANPKQPWDQRLREAAGHVEDDVRRLITYLNDEVVPDVRRNSSEALRAAAVELHRLAQRMDESPRPGTPPNATPPPPTPRPPNNSGS